MQNNNKLIFDEFDYVEKKIDYEFNNKDLLFQAFTRKSYAEENGRGLHNDNLEFLGDQVLSFYVTKFIMERHGYIKVESNNSDVKIEDKGYFGLNAYNSAEQLSKIKKDFVSNDMLAHRIDMLHFAKYLRVGKGDDLNDVKNNIKVKGDLFEAIVGAVAVDSEYDSETMEHVVNQMLDMNFYMVHGFDIDRDDYRSTVNEWYQKNYHKNIIYVIQDQPDGTFKASVQLNMDGTIKNYSGEGHNGDEARLACAKVIYNHEIVKPLTHDLIKDILDKAHLGDVLGLDNAVSFLNFLYQSDIIEEPYYEMPTEPCDKDKNGNPIWNVFNEITTVAETAIYSNEGYAYRVKDAKKIAAYLSICEYMDIDPLYDDHGNKIDKLDTINAEKLMDEVTSNAINRYNEENKNGHNVANVKVTMALLEKKASEALKDNKDYIEIVSGELQKELGLSNRCPSMCNAMRKFGNTSNLVKDYVVMSNPDIQNSSTYKIKYLLKTNN